MFQLESERLLLRDFRPEDFDAFYATAEGLGMRLEGVFRHHRYFRGRWWDSAVYALLAQEWQARMK